MTDVSMSPVLHHDVDTSTGGGRATSGVAAWLGLAAAPTFAIMALWSGLFQRPTGHALHDDARLIADGRNTVMYLLMSAFHAAPVKVDLLPTMRSPPGAW